MYNYNNNNNNMNINAPLTDAERAERIRRLNQLYQQQEMQQYPHQHQHQHQQHNTLNQGSTAQPYYGINRANNNNNNQCYVEKNNINDVNVVVDDDEDEDDECIDKAEEAFLDKMEQHMNTLQSKSSAPHSISGNANPATHSTNAATADSSSAQTTFYRIDESEMNTGTVIATETNVQRRTIGDFELLRLAKVGDKESFYHFASTTHTTIASFEDNQKRNALHYAADSGNLLLIRALHEDQRVFDALNVSDAKGLLPIDIVLLNGYKDSEIMEILQPSSSSESTATATEQTTSHTSENDYALKVSALLAKFAPTPPRFVLSKPIPPAPSTSNQTTLFMRSFWRQYKTIDERISVARTTLSEAQSARHIHVMEYTNPTHLTTTVEEEKHAELELLLRKFCTHMQYASREQSTGLLRTLHDQCLLHTLPALALDNNENDNTHMTPRTCRVFCALHQKSTNSDDNNSTTNMIGVLVVKMVEGTFHYGKQQQQQQQSKNDASLIKSNAFVRVVYLGVLPEYRKSGVASLLLHYLYLHLSDNIGYDDIDGSGSTSEVAKPMTAEGNDLVNDGVVFFTTSSQLVQPPSTVGAVKWFARILHPSKLFKIGENSYHYVHGGNLINNTTTSTGKADIEPEMTEGTKDDHSNVSNSSSKVSTSSGSCMTITGNDLIANLFHSFIEYDTVLRADIILKNALAEGFVHKLAELCTQWMLIDDSHIDHVASFLSTTCQNATQPSSSSSSSSSSSFETNLCFIPTSAQELRAMLQHNNKDLRVYARFAHGTNKDKSHSESSVDKHEITDLVIVQVHTFKDATAMMNENAHSSSNVLFNLENDSANVSTGNDNNTNPNKQEMNQDDDLSLTDLRAAQVVFSMFTTFKGVDKVEVMLSLANQYIHADALFVPTVCGTTDSDLVKVNFEEFLACRDFLYAVNRKEPCTSCALPTPVSQLCLPLCLCE